MSNIYLSESKKNKNKDLAKKLETWWISSSGVSEIIYIFAKSCLRKNYNNECKQLKCFNGKMNRLISRLKIKLKKIPSNTERLYYKFLLKGLIKYRNTKMEEQKLVCKYKKRKPTKRKRKPTKRKVKNNIKKPYRKKTK